ncbi:MAG: D-lyxose/D-mannose family sugar isomerase [Clostridiaceae bacterium]|nr:D-lyxose/D-mannose family sugar isomerase [Clostridiaceae bacterium]
MKRSEINRIVQDGIEFFKAHKFVLPPFAYWSPEEWQTKGKEYDEIWDNHLGWDITDFGSGDFYNTGLFLFTLRNGNVSIPKYKKTYAEKIMIVGENQVTPFHFHWKKTEDIINRGGGNLMVRLYNSTSDGKFADTSVTVNSDGKEYEVPAGTTIRLQPGESITLYPGLYHSFWGEAGKGRVLVGEVSECNDDYTDNRFYEEIGRFPSIEEDEPPKYYLVNDYPKASEGK